MHKRDSRPSNLNQLTAGKRRAWAGNWGDRIVSMLSILAPSRWIKVLSASAIRFGRIDQAAVGWDQAVANLPRDSRFVQPTAARVLTQ